MLGKDSMKGDVIGDPVEEIDEDGPTEDVVEAAEDSCGIRGGSITAPAEGR